MIRLASVVEHSSLNLSRWLSNVFRERGLIDEYVINTGQHYDPKLSDIFFAEMEIAPPKYNLGIGSGPVVDQIGKMLPRLREIFTDDRPDFVLVYGDTNSTLAGTLAAAHLGVPVAHVEAGERLYRRIDLPEEVNRVATDQLATLLLTSTKKAQDYLAREGVNPRRIRFVGDPMYDLFLRNRERVSPDVLARYGVEPGQYRLSTIHRVENTDNVDILISLLAAMDRSSMPVLLPLHPRVENILNTRTDWRPSGNLRLVDAVGYADFLSLLLSAEMVITDSGGVTREAFFAGIRCVTPLQGCWWSEAVDSGWNIITGQDAGALERALEHFPVPPHHDVCEFGNGRSGELIEEAISEWLEDGPSMRAGEGDWHPVGSFAELPGAKNTPFSYDHYDDLVSGLREAGYSFIRFPDANASGDDSPFALMRHDIDYDLLAAADLAEREAALGVTATYFLMVRTEHYNLFSEEGTKAIERIASLGHGIGLHFDVAAYDGLTEEKAISQAVRRECRILEEWTGQTVEAVSFHRPLPQLVGSAEDLFAPVTNAYARSLTHDKCVYISDSRGEWGHGHPLESDAFKQGRSLQILTHPVWWRPVCASPFETMMRWASSKDARLKKSIADNNSLFRIGIFDGIVNRNNS